MAEYVYNFEEEVQDLELTLMKDGEPIVFHGVINDAVLYTFEKFTSKAMQGVENNGSMNVVFDGNKLKVAVFDACFKQDLRKFNQFFKTTDDKFNLMKINVYDNMIEKELGKLKKMRAEGTNNSQE